MSGGHRRATQGCMLPSGSHGLFHQKQGARFAGPLGTECRYPSLSGVSHARSAESIPRIILRVRSSLTRCNPWRIGVEGPSARIPLIAYIGTFPKKSVCRSPGPSGRPSTTLAAGAGPGARSRSSNTTSRISTIGLFSLPSHTRPEGVGAGGLPVRRCRRSLTGLGTGVRLFRQFAYLGLEFISRFGAVGVSNPQRHPGYPFFRR